MHSKGLVSIIVPVHNSEKYVQNIFQNILNQSYGNWELIFVDDHSTDSTVKLILDGMALIKNKVLLKENTGKGVSSARNVGIRNLSGDFVAFIDDDDEISKDYLKLLVNGIMMNHSEICFCSYYEIYKQNKNKKILPWSGSYTSKEAIRTKVIPQLIFPRRSEDSVWLPVWRTLIDAEFLRRSQVFFNKQVSQAEDFIFLLELLLKSTRIFFLRDNLIYYYKRRSNSTMNLYIEDNLHKQYLYHDGFRKLMKQYGIYEPEKIRYLSNRLAMYSIAISNATRKNNRASALREMKNIRCGFLQDNSFEKISIYRLYNGVMVKGALTLLKFNFIHTLYVIYSCKEKRRLQLLRR